MNIKASYEPSQVVETLDDATIAQRIAAGDRRLFEALMRRCNRRLYRLARSVLRDDSEAEDALQDAYFQAHRSISQYRGDASLATWLSRLVLNESLARLRKSVRRDNVIPMAASEEIDTVCSNDNDFPDKIFMRTQMRAIVERKLDRLPEDFRTVFVLRAIEELSVDETANCLGIPAATVRSRYFRARSLLRESLAQEIDIAERDLFEFGGAHCDRIVAAVNSRLDIA